MVLNAFASSKLDDMKSSRRKLEMPRPADTRAFFAKYLTSEKVMYTSMMSVLIFNQWEGNVH